MILRAILLLVLAGLAGAARADDVKYFKIRHEATGKVLGILDDNEGAGAKTALINDGDSEFLQWKTEKDGEYLKLVNRKTGMVLDVFEASKDEGTAIIQWDDKPEDYENQRWSWIGEGKLRRLKSKHSELVLDIGEEGLVVQKKADDKAKSQLWDLVEVKK